MQVIKKRHKLMSRNLLLLRFYILILCMCKQLFWKDTNENDKPLDLGKGTDAGNGQTGDKNLFHKLSILHFLSL